MAKRNRPQSGVRFARVPSGGDTCPFCMMLASRGAVYYSEQTAGADGHYHPNCRCRIVPSWGTAEIEGYDPALYYDMWKNPEKYAAPKDGTSIAPIPEFTPARTIAEAEEYVRKFVDDSMFGATGVSYAGVNIDVANIINDAVNKFFGMFDVPKLGGVIAPAGNTKLGKLVAQASASAAYSPIRQSILLRRDLVKNAKAMTASLLEDKRVAQEWLEHPERFHFDRMSKRVQKVLTNSVQSGRALVPETAEEAIFHELGHHIERALSKEQIAILKEGMQKFASGVSGYATDSVGEYIAESVAAYMKGETLNDPEMLKILDGMRKR